MSINDVHKKMRRLGRSTIGHAHVAWKKKKEAQKTTDTVAVPVQATLPGVKRMGSVREPEALVDQPLGVDAPQMRGGFVQHAGSWLMLGLLKSKGLYDSALRATNGRVEEPMLRVAIDAVATALALGQGCVEGVRRIATPTAPVLLRASRCPSPPTVRAVMRKLSDELGSVTFHVAMIRKYLAEDTRRESGVYYVDNHLRTYTGKYTIRRGWRMQDKRVVPGITDYYVHDEEGRPLFRVDVPTHDSLTQWLAPLAKIVREVVGEKERVLFAFDRAGAFPEAMAELRNGGFEFVTYERRPFAILPESAFTETAKIDGDALRYCESQTNLGLRRGRVRRIAVREPDEGRQINLVAVSTLPARRIIEIMRRRWRQENAFKHGVERWGINQLDRRKVESYSPDTIIPNPARRRLDREARETAIREGDARCRLAEFADRDPRRARIEKEIDAANMLRRALDDRRASAPKHAALSETELAGKLVRHDGKVKLALDTIRIACANAESELAEALTRHLSAPREAKKTLANLFAAPGRIRVRLHTISIDLAPAATQNEREAFDVLLKAINRRNLSLPGDPHRRKLRFRCRIQ